ncbi:MAG: hypothetical protein IH968_13605 [Gemmatimonadetes bacterium]|nr:hypothetical protein [Gemmatimonadota bacterium]
MHIFELCRDDFAALVTHTPLRVRWSDVATVLGGPSAIHQRLFLLYHRDDHIVGQTFRSFQFFELAFADGESA